MHYRKDGAIKSQGWKEIPNSDITAATYKKLNFNYELPVDIDEINLMFYGNPGKSINLYISEIKLEIGSKATSFTLAPEDTDEAVRTVQNQLAGSWAVQNLNSAGSIVSQINATNNQILIEAEKIRLKGKTLLDELTAINGYFKRLFVGEGNFAKLNAEIIGANTITADKLIMDQAMAKKILANDFFTENLFAKQAFINRMQAIDFSANQIKGGIIKSLNDVTQFDLVKGILNIKQNNGTTMTINEDGLSLKRNKDILFSILDNGSSYSKINSVSRMSSFSTGWDSSIGFVALGGTPFIEIAPNANEIYLNSGFKMSFGKNGGVPLEHIFGQYDNNWYTGFKAKGTNRDKLMFYDDGRIEILKG